MTVERETGRECKRRQSNNKIKITSAKQKSQTDWTCFGDLWTKCIGVNVCVCDSVHNVSVLVIAISVVRFNRNALYCARQHLISEAVETSLIDLNCDGAIKIADLKSNIFRSALKMTILFHVIAGWLVVVVVVVVVFLMLFLFCVVLFCFEYFTLPEPVSVRA